jgi:orotidine-5'-phosphate decarboxylase
MLVAGVSLLTDHLDEDARAIYHADNARQVVVEAAERMAEASEKAKVPAGLVCAPAELEDVRHVPLIKITPNIRDANAKMDDQNKARSMPADDAFVAGADYLVIGRPIMEAPDPAAAIKAFSAQIAAKYPPGSLVDKKV